MATKYNILGQVSDNQPKLGYRFAVSFGSLGGDATTSTTLTGYVNSFTPASFSQESVTIDAYVSRYYVVGKHTIGQLTVELRNDVSNNVVTAIQKQIDKQYNSTDQTHARNAGDVKFITKLFYLDGSRAATAAAATIIESFVYTGCWITDVQFGQLSYSDSNPVTISVTIQPDDMYHIVSTISGADGVNSGASTSVTARTVTATTAATSAT